MAALGLGDDRGLPVPGPARPPPGARRHHPARRSSARSTPAGASPRSAAGSPRLPVDPRLGRMVLEADRLGCADEVIVIAAALSIQDPRERPADRQAQADQQHARFADEGSDFLAYLNLWRYVRERQRELSANQFRTPVPRRVPALPAHPRVAGPRRPAAPGGQGGRRDGQPRARRAARRASSRCSSGLLSHLGLKDSARREYLGARGARFALWPGSALARRPPAWVMVAELVETSRLWGRDAARIEPALGRAAGRAPAQAHLLRAALGAPARLRWSRPSG